MGGLSQREKRGGVQFLDLADSTGIAQIVVEKNKVSKDEFKIAQKISIESAIEVRGTVTKNSRNQEITAHTIRVINQASLSISPSPRENIDIFDPSLANQLLSKRHLYLRNPKVMAILRFRSFMLSRVRAWFEERKFLEINAPILTKLPLYMDDSALRLDVHGEEVFLTQCVGFYLEAATHAFERVYNMGPSFRGEESKSKRHLMEYWHIKAEAAFMDLEDIIATVESLFAYITGSCKTIGNEVSETLETHFCVEGAAIPFERIQYAEAIEYLRKRSFDISFGHHLGSKEEAELSKNFSGPFWVVGIPRVVEPFPYVIDIHDPRITRVADLIASRGYGELLGTAEKICDHAELEERLKEKGKEKDTRYAWVREVHDFGCVPHAAFGMGVERMIRWLLDFPHVRDAIPFPRTFKRSVYP